MIAGAALRRLQAGDAAGALHMLAGFEDDDANAHSVRGMALLESGDAAGAIAAFRGALAAGDGSPATLLNLALAQDAAGERHEARALMRRVGAADPGWDEPHLRLAESHRRVGELQAAEAAYRQALERAPGRLESLVGLGALLVRRGAGEEAQLLLQIRKSVV